MNQFYVFAFALITVVAAGSLEGLASEEKTKMETYRKACLEETKLDEKVLADVEKEIYADDPKLKSFILCYSKMADFQNAKGELQFDVIKQRLLAKQKTEKETMALIESCFVQKATPEVTAFDAMVCFKKTDPKLVLF